MRRFVFTFAGLILLFPLLLKAQIEPIVNSVLDGKVTDKQTLAALAGADVRIKGTTHLLHQVIYIKPQNIFS